MVPLIALTMKSKSSMSQEEAMETIKELTGIGESLAGRLLIWQALSARFRLIAIPRDPACVCGRSAE